MPKHGHNAFTLAELLVVLMVKSIILTAVVTLAFAMGTANDTGDDTAQKQAHVRYATLRISELVKHCKLICGTPGNDMVIWKADYNDDGGINPAELVYIESGKRKNHIRLLDIKMPGRDGYGVFEDLKASAKTMSIPVMFFSALLPEQAQEKATQLGADGFISKSADPDEILIKVMEVLDKLESPPIKQK